MARERRSAPGEAVAAGKGAAARSPGAAASGDRPEPTSGRRAWWLVAALSLGVAVSNGFARFAYGLILPSMQVDLGWSYTEAGWINTANAIGYVAGALAVFGLIARLSPARLFSAGMVGVTVALLLSGLTSDFWLLTLWRVVAGVFGAFVFIAGGALAAGLFRDNPGRNALAIALFFGGGGVGMILSGAALPALFAAWGPAAWPAAWLLLGAASGLASLAAVVAAERLREPPDPGDGDRPHAPLPVRRMAFELAGYAAFATGYIVYVTFLVAWMESLRAGAVLVSAVWVVVGLGVVLSPFLWRPVLARFAGGTPLALATGAVAVGTLLPVALPTAAGLLLSGAVFGLSIFMAPSAVTTFGRKNLPRAAWGRAIGLFTVILSVFQTIGPVAAGALGDVFGSIDAGLYAAAAILFAGAAVAALQRPLPAPGRGG